MVTSTAVGRVVKGCLVLMEIPLWSAMRASRLREVWWHCKVQSFGQLERLASKNAHPPHVLFLTGQKCRFSQPWHSVIFHGICSFMAWLYFPNGWLFDLEHHHFRVIKFFLDFENVLNRACDVLLTIHLPIYFSRFSRPLLSPFFHTLMFFNLHRNWYKCFLGDFLGVISTSALSFLIYRISQICYEIRYVCYVAPHHEFFFVSRSSEFKNKSVNYEKS